MKRILILGVLAGLTLASVLWLLLRRPTADAVVGPLAVAQVPVAAEPPASGPAVARASEALDPGETAAAQAGETVPTRARAAGSCALEGAIFDRAGVGLEGVRVRWTSLLPEWCQYKRISEQMDWEQVAACSVETATDREGHFLFASAPDQLSGRPSVVWMECAGWRSQAVFLEPDSRLWPAAVRLEPAERRVAWVTSQGAPRAGAEVEVWSFPSSDTLARYALLPGGRTNSATLRGGLRVLRLLLTTDAEGRAVVPEVLGGSSMRARAPGLTSAIREVRAGEVQLELCQSFSVAGSVTGFDPARGAEPLLLQFWGLRGEQFTELGSLAVAPDGAILSTPLVCMELDSCLFLPRGRGLVSESQYIEVPVAGELRRIDFQAEAGHAAWVQVVDEQDQPLAGATVVLSWLTPASQGTAEADTEEQGYAQIDGLRSVPHDLLVLHAGLVDFKDPAALTPPLAKESAYRARMQRPARLSGRVTHAGQPVTQFAVVVNEHDRPGGQEPELREFQDEQGRFEIEALLPGDIGVRAFSADMPESSVQELRLTAGGSSTVELELPAGELLEGRVLDAYSRQPLAGVEVQLGVLGKAYVIHMRTEPVRTDALGEFRRDALGPGRNLLSFTLPGYAPALEYVEAAARAQQSRLVFLLQPMGELELHVDCGAEQDPARLRYYLESDPENACAPPGADGILHVPGLGPGTQRLMVEYTDELYLLVDLLLEPAARWKREVTLGGSARLLLELRAPADLARELRSLRAQLEWQSSASTSVKCSLAMPLGALQGSLAVDALPEGPVYLTLFQADQVYATRRLELARGDNRVEIELGQHGRRLLVVDGAGEPLSGVGVQVCEAAGEQHFCVERRTDASGLADLGSGRATGLQLSLVKVGLGRLVIEDWSFEEDEPKRLVFDPKSVVRLRCLDGEQPLSGLSVSLRDARAGRILAYALSSADGRVDFERIEADELVARAEGAAIWPRSVPVLPSPSAVEQLVQLRQRTDASLRVLSEGGLAIVGAQVELWSLEFGEPLSEWIAAGQVGCGEHGLSSDAQGRIEVRGLPHGSYSYRCSFADGSTRSGLVELGMQSDRAVDL